MTFKEILDKYGIPNVEGGNHKNVRSGFIGFDCPNCNPGSGKFHAAYSLPNHFINCWVCGPLPLVKTLIELTREPYHVIKELLGDLRRDYSPVLEKPTGKLELPTNLIELNKVQREYLRSRGFKDPKELTRIWGLKGIGLHPHLAWRVFIPVMLRQKIVSWTTRSLSEESTAKYVNAKPTQESIPIKSTLFGWDFVGHSILLTEGPLDAMRIGPGAVCGFGMNITSKQFSLLAQKPIRIICLDNESDAQRKAKELVRNLSILPGKTILACVESAKDPGSASEKEIKQLRKLLT